MNYIDLVQVRHGPFIQDLQFNWIVNPFLMLAAFYKLKKMLSKMLSVECKVKS